MKLHGAVGGVFFCLFAVSLAASGCSSSSTPDNGGGNGGGHGGGSGGGISTIPDGCSADDSLDCSGGGTGITCPSGTTPDPSAGVCSDPSDQGDGTDGFCCIAFSDPGCTQDDTVTASCEYPSYGFTCASGSADPSADDPSLNCSAPSTDADGNDIYCCEDTGSGGTSSGGSTGGGCASDSSLACDAGTTGVSCDSSSTPDEATFGICSDPSPQSDGSDGYCCVDETFSDCVEDDTVTASCDYPSFGFSCSGGSPDPSTDDPSITCSDPTTDANGNDLYCCQ
jgi:hypothetical protein